MTVQDIQPSTLRMTAGEQVSKVLSTASLLSPCGKILDSFPCITVDYQGKHHPCQDIHGPRRDGIGTRIIRTPIRPLFPSGFYHDVKVMARVLLSILSCSGHHDIDVLAANAALMLLDILWGGPIGVVRVGRIQEQFVVNPLKYELPCCDINLIYACTRDKAIVVDVQVQEVSEEDLASALRLAHQDAVNYIEPQIKFSKQTGKCKKDYKLSMLVKDSTVRKFDSLEEAPFVACEITKGEEYLAKITGDANKVMEVEENHDIEKLNLLQPFMVDKPQTLINYRTLINYLTVTHSSHRK
ncbi:hypothetical protein MKX03_014827 [Papaver bracteatum]|nr:hypothetical protein MKX03_014827 [Papaver bracteatum]